MSLSRLVLRSTEGFRASRLPWMWTSLPSVPRPVVLLAGLWLLLAAGAPGLLAQTFTVEVEGGTLGDLWIDLDQRRWAVLGHCDDNGPLLQQEEQGDGWVLEFEDELVEDFPQRPFRAVQRFRLEVEDERGTLYLLSPQGLSELDLPVRVEWHTRRTACSSGTDRRK